MNVELATQSPEKKYINGIFVEVLSQVSLLFIVQQGLGHFFRYRPFFFLLAGGLCTFYANDRGK